MNSKFSSSLLFSSSLFLSFLLQVTLIIPFLERIFLSNVLIFFLTFFLRKQKVDRHFLPGIWLRNIMEFRAVRWTVNRFGKWWQNDANYIIYLTRLCFIHAGEETLIIVFCSNQIGEIWKKFSLHQKNFCRREKSGSL